MSNQMSDGQHTPQRIAERVAACFRRISFQTKLGGNGFDDDRLVLSYPFGYFIFNEKAFTDLVGCLVGHFPTIDRSTIYESAEKLCRQLIDDFVQRQDLLDWTRALTPSELPPEIVPTTLLQSASESLLADLEKVVHDFTVFVPLMGIDLKVREYDFGPIKLVRSEESLPHLERANGTGRFIGFNDEDLTWFDSFPCLVQVQVTGSVDYARQRALALAEYLAAILNLHFAHWRLRSHFHQIIRCATSTEYVKVLLARAELPDKAGVVTPTYLPSISKHNAYAMPLNQTSLNAVKALGFDTLWKSIADITVHEVELFKRLRRAVTWFGKAATFDERDAQFVGLATALEILLVRSGDVNNPFSSWTGITQQLAERCAFLLGHDLRTSRDFAAQVKRLYGVRSKIVHSGSEPTREQIDELVELVSWVIIEFAQRDFESFGRFEGWVELQKFSVNLSEIDKFRTPGQ